LGLIYEVKVSNDLDIEVIMSLTSPFCPAAQSMPAEIKEKLEKIEE
jgi:metal-sulfur cluster biosynthetic enzyme